MMMARQMVYPAHTQTHDGLIAAQRLLWQLRKKAHPIGKGRG
jgi:hypothetical protein